MGKMNNTINRSVTNTPNDKKVKQGHNRGIKGLMRPENNKTIEKKGAYIIMVGS